MLSIFTTYKNYTKVVTKRYLYLTKKEGVKKFGLHLNFQEVTMSSGTSSGSSQGTQSSRSEDDLDLQAQMEKRRKRRKESNRESARRSRLRKQQHLDDLTSQVYIYVCVIYVLA